MAWLTALGCASVVRASAAVFGTPCAIAIGLRKEGKQADRQGRAKLKRAQPRDEDRIIRLVVCKR